MKINIRYDNVFQEIEVDKEEMERWLHLSFFSNETEMEREKAVQEGVDILLNRPEYNNWHRMDRHRGMPKKSSRKEDQEADRTDGMDELEDTNFSHWWEEKEEYESLCLEIRTWLAKKPEWAEAVIAVYLDGESIRDYTSRIGDSENNVTQKLKRAKRNLKKILKNRQIFD